MLGSPRDFSVARYATVCETEPMPWDPGTPLDQRPAVVQQRIGALPPDTFTPFDPPIVVEDEIDLCLRWPDVPRPPSGAAPLPYPTAPTLILQGGEDLRTPPEVRLDRGPDPGLGAARGAGHRAFHGQRPAHLRRSAIVRFVRGAPLPKSCKRIPTGIPAVLGAPESFDSLRGFGGLPRKIGRTVSALGATVDDLRLVVSPAALATSGGGLRGGSWTISGDRLILRRYEAVDGVTLTGSGNESDHAARRGLQGGARDGHAALRWAVSGTLGGRRISLRLGSPRVRAAPQASRALSAPLIRRPPAAPAWPGATSVARRLE